MKVGPIIQASLRTKEPRLARIRHAIADGALKRIWNAERECGSFDTLTEASEVAVSGSVSIAAKAAGPSPVKIAGPPLTVGDLFERWVLDRADKRALNTIKAYRGSIRSFDAATKGRDVRTLTGDDVYAWAVRRRDVEGISVRTINKNDLVAVSSVFRWSCGRSAGQLLSTNPATGITLDGPRIVAQRERTFREHEIAAILLAAFRTVPSSTYPAQFALRRWVPWLAAYTGARITELTNLLGSDVRFEAGIAVMHLRVTKTGEPRTVPIHSHLVEQGFLALVADVGPNPLFYDPKRHKRGAQANPAEMQGRSLGRWIRQTVKLDGAVDPNHGWRHTWKTRALGAGIEQRLRDAITGHSPGSVGRRYETPTLKMLAEAMDQFPRYTEA